MPDKMMYDCSMQLIMNAETAMCFYTMSSSISVISISMIDILYEPLPENNYMSFFPTSELYFVSVFAHVLPKTS